MLQMVLECTNAKISALGSKYQKQDATIDVISPRELEALFGLLIRGGTMKHQSRDIEMLQSETELFGSEYQCCFSAKRHQWLLNVLRFDHAETRNKRRASCKLAHIKKSSTTDFFRTVARITFRDITFV